MELLVKAAAVSVVAAVCALLIKSKNPELSFVITLLTAVSVTFLAVGIFGELLELAAELVESYGLSETLFKPVLKCLGIALVTKLVYSLCNDAGQSATASAVEYLGSVMTVLTAIPLLSSVLSTVEALL